MLKKVYDFMYELTINHNKPQYYRALKVVILILRLVSFTICYNETTTLH